MIPKVRSHSQGVSGYYRKTLLQVMLRFPLAALLVFTLTLQAELRAAEVTGRITDSHTGEGIPQAIVRALPEDKGRQEIQVLTDRRGRYLLDLLKGRYRIYIGVPNSNYLSKYYSSSKYYSNFTDSDGEDIIQVPTFDSFIVLNASLEMGGSIAGEVTRRSNPIPLANVRIYAESSDYRVSTLTRKDGSYLLRGLPPDEFLVYVGTLGEQYVPVYFDDALSSDEATRVPLERRQEVGEIDFGLRLAGMIRGQVRARKRRKPLEGIKVIAEKEGSFQTSRFTYTDAQGRYALGGLSEGLYLLEAGPPEREGGPKDQRPRFLSQFYPNRFDRDLASPLAVDAGATLSNIDFTLTQDCMISGKVLSLEDEAPLEAVQIIPQLVGQETLHPAGTRTDASGSFMLQDLPPGDYFLGMFLPARHRRLIEVYYQDKLSLSKADKIALEEGSHIRNIDFNLLTGASLGGTVSVEEPGYRFHPERDVIELKRLDFDPRGSEDQALKIEPDGSFRLQGVPGGRYSLTPKLSDTNLMALTSPNSRVVEVIEGDTIDDLDFAFALGGSILGSVVSDSEAYDLGQLQLVLINFVENTSSFFDIPSMQYTIAGLSPGRYFLVLRSNPDKTHPGKRYGVARVFDTKLVEVEQGISTSGVNLRVLQTGAEQPHF